jgi:spore maturation protein CgeB
MDIDVQTIFPQLRHLSSRSVLRLFKKRLICEYNDLILDTASTFQPDLLLAFKGSYVDARTLRALQSRKIRLYNYYPDTSPFAHGPLLGESLSEYDCVFFTKRFWKDDVSTRINLRYSVFLPHGYDPEVHCPWDLDSKDISHYAHDVSVIATYTSHKQEVLNELVSVLPHIDLRIWGNQWERCTSPILKRFIAGAPLVGSSYAKALKAIRINLAIMSGIVAGSSQGDESTTRTYEIPACGGFMLHERSEEVLELFEEGKEVVCFSSTEELAKKIEYYLAHPNERRAIAHAGRARCVPAYSYDNRMMEIVKWDQQHHPGTSCLAGSTNGEAIGDFTNQSRMISKSPNQSKF